jgi:hypothetical protein
MLSCHLSFYKFCCILQVKTVVKRRQESSRVLSLDQRAYDLLCSFSISQDYNFARGFPLILLFFLSILKNKRGTRFTPMFQWPDKSLSLGVTQALAWKRSGLMVRPSVQVR